MARVHADCNRHSSTARLRKWVTKPLFLSMLTPIPMFYIKFPPVFSVRVGYNFNQKTQIRRQIPRRQTRHHPLLHGKTPPKPPRKLRPRTRLHRRQNWQKPLRPCLQRPKSTIFRPRPPLRLRAALPRRPPRWSSRHHAPSRAYNKLLQTIGRKRLGACHRLMGSRTPRSIDPAHRATFRERQSDQIRSPRRRRRCKSISRPSSYFSVGPARS